MNSTLCRIPLLAAVFAASLGMGAAAAEVHIVMMKFNDDTAELYFEPAQLKIQPGDTVLWVQNDADNEHNVAAYPDRIPAGTEPFVSPMMTEPGESWRMTFTKAGSYFYHCHPHEAAGMRGLLIVGRQSLPEEFRVPKAGDMQHDHGGGDDDEMEGHEMEGHHESAGDDDSGGHHGSDDHGTKHDDAHDH